MMKMKKFTAVLLVLLMIIAAIPTALAAGVTAKPGETATVSFSTEEAYGVNGSISANGSTIKKVFDYGTEAKTWSYSVSVAVPESAKAGDVITVTFNYEWSDAEGNMTSGARSATVTVVEEQGTQPTEPKPTEPKPTEPKPTEPKPTEPKPTEPKPTTPSENKPAEGNVDYTELERQIKIAEGLDETLYTAESWAAMQEALTEAKKALTSTSQKTVDEAAADLADAIAKLVTVNYADMEGAVASGEELAANNEIGNLWFRLFEAIEEALALKGSNDQEAIDAATQKILDIVEELKAAIAAAGEGVIKEIFVEKEPEGDYCNREVHTIWPIVAVVSLAVNVLFTAVVGVGFSRRKKIRKDDTPLVNYDIDEDA